MELDKPIPNPEQPSDNGEKKEKKKRSRKRRSPRHVPLHIETQTEEKQEKKPEKPQSEEKEEPKAEKTEKKSDPQVTDLEVESKSAPDKHIEQLDRQSELQDEAVFVPLEADELEGEVFISDRLLHSDKPTVAEAVPEEVSEEPVVSTSERDEDEPATAATTTRPKATAPAATAQTARTTPPPTPRAVNPTTVPAGPNPISNIWNRYFPPAGPGGGGANLPPNPNAPAAANIAPAVPATTPPVEQLELRNRHAERKNLIVGLIVGGLIEHIRHRSREKRKDKEYRKNVEKLTDTQKATEGLMQRNEQKAGREKTALEQHLEELRRKQNLPPSVPLQAAERSTSENHYQQPAPRAEQVFGQNTMTLPERKAVEKPQPNVAEQQELEVPLPPDRRVESSAWHRIEVDKKTGHAVENPTIAYGEEYQNEQHQEKLRREIEEASVDSATVLKRYMPNEQNVDTKHRLPEHAQPDDYDSDSFKVRAADMFEEFRTAASNVPPIDIALWALLGFIVLAIIAVL